MTISYLKPNALTKHRSKSFRLHHAIQLLVIMMQLILKILKIMNAINLVGIVGINLVFCPCYLFL